MGLRPFFKDILTTLSTAIAIAITSIIATRFIARGLGPDEFGLFSTGRRAAFLITTLASLDIGVCLARYLGLSRNNPSATRKYFFVCAAIVLLTTTAVVGAGLLLASPLSFAIFGSSEYHRVTVSLLFLVFGHSMYTLAHSYFRGIGRIRIANLLQLSILSMGTLTVAVWFSSRSTAADILYYLGFLFFACAPFVVIMGFRFYLRERSSGGFAASTREIVRYGGPRVLGAMAYQSFYSIGPILAAHFSDLRSAGFLAVGQMLIMMIIELTAGAFSFVALPKAAQMVAENNLQVLQSRAKDLVAIALHLGVFCSIQLWLWMEEVIEVWLGKEYSHATTMGQLFAPSFMFFLVYALLRPIIDAIEVQAINTYNLIAGLAIAALTGALLGAIGLGAMGVGFGVMIGVSTVGYLTIRYLWRRCSFRARDFRFEVVLPCNLFFLLVGYVTHLAICSAAGRTASLLLGIALEIVMIVSYLFCLDRFGVEWIRKTAEAMLQRRVGQREW